MTKQQIQARLESLQAEFEKGRHRIQQIDQERSSLEQNMLRIDGAIEVLKELLESQNDQVSNQDHPESPDVVSLNS